MREEKLAVISIFDPAIDAARVPMPVWREYGITRNIALLERYIIPGKRPSVYHIREMPRSAYFGFVLNGQKSAETMRAFMVGVMQVDNVQQPDGSYIDWQPVRDPGWETIREESLDKIGCYEIEEIGEVCKQHSGFRLSTASSFHLEPSLADRWGGYLVHRVGASQSSPASSSAEASKSEDSTPSGIDKTASQSAQSGADSGSPTDATATASA